MAKGEDLAARMETCTNCGQQFDGQFRFCPMCGQYVPGASGTPVAVTAVAPVGTPPAPGAPAPAGVAPGAHASAPATHAAPHAAPAAPAAHQPPGVLMIVLAVPAILLAIFLLAVVVITSYAGIVSAFLAFGAPLWVGIVGSTLLLLLVVGGIGYLLFSGPIMAVSKRMQARRAFHHLGEPAKRR
jgi:hypothetical protein